MNFNNGKTIPVPYDFCFSNCGCFKPLITEMIMHDGFEDKKEVTVNCKNEWLCTLWNDKLSKQNIHNRICNYADVNEMVQQIKMRFNGISK